MPPLPDLDDFEQATADQWAEVHKRSALVHLIMAGLSNGPKWSAELTEFIEDATKGAWGVDERSLYRALRRLERSELVAHATETGSGTGAKRKIFTITESGSRVLHEYETTTLAYLEQLGNLKPSTPGTEA